MAFRPWTVQNRVADMAFLADTLFCGLNGSGIASLGLEPSGTATFAYHFDSLIFAHRTITAIFPRQGTLAMHVYYNALLNDAPQQDLTLTGISLVSYLPAKANFGFLIPPFQRKNPDYEAVGFAPVTENQYDFEWKFTDTRETRFAYTRFNAETQTEEKESRDAYLDALGVPFIAGAAVPPDLASFFAVCKGALPAPAPAPRCSSSFARGRARCAGASDRRRKAMLRSSSRCSKRRARASPCCPGAGCSAPLPVRRLAPSISPRCRGGFATPTW